MKFFKLIWLVAAFQIACVSQFVVAEPGKLSVNGSATLFVEPDFVTLNFYVSREATQAVAANQQVSEVMSQLITIARQQDIAEVDLKTSGISISENRRSRNDNCSAPGIQAQQTLTVVLRDLELVEELIDEMVEAGALIVGGAQPGVDDLEEYSKQALQLAIDNARDQAGVAAEQLGLSVGEAIEVSFSSRGSRRRDQFAWSTSNMPSAASPVTYLPGLIPISQSVSVTFKSSVDQ